MTDTEGFTPDELEIARLRVQVDLQGAMLAHLQQRVFDLTLDLEAATRKERA